MSTAKKNTKSNLDSGSINVSHQFNPSRFVTTSLFNEALVLRDIDKELHHYWSNEETSGFMDFWTQLCMYSSSFNEYGESKFNWNYEENLSNVVLPILQMLGYGELDNKTLNHFLYHEEFEVPTLNGTKSKIRVPVLIANNSSSKDELLKFRSSDGILSLLRKKCVVPVTVDYFDALADKKIGKYSPGKNVKHQFNDNFAFLGKEIQCSEYLNLLDKEFGISTDGSRWRIIHKTKTKEDSTLFYEFDLLKFLEIFEGVDSSSIIQNESALNCAKWFYWFFSKEGLSSDGMSFLSEVEIKARKYADNIEEDLKTRFVHAMTITVNGYVEAVKNKKLNSEINLIVTASESFIFNLFFLRSCESKGIIPFHQDYKKISLANLIAKIQYYRPSLTWNENMSSLQALASIFGKALDAEGFELYTHIQNLFETIQNGNNGFQISGFIETVFEKEEFSLYKNCELKNSVVLGLLHQLMFYKDGATAKEIPYNTFSPRQLGSIFESFLEYKPKQATSKLFYFQRITTKEGKKVTSWSWQKQDELPGNVSQKELYGVSKGDYIFAPNNDDRKSTGVYYTPHYIVEHIVKETIGPLTSRMKSSEEIFNIKICDPAMGSAHFLVESLNYLHKEFLRLDAGKDVDTDIKRLILQSSIFGVDLNPRAVKLAKMSLWLSTACPGKSLEHLDDQLKAGNSLDGDSFDWNRSFTFLKKSGGFDAVVGNPPYVENSKADLSSYTINNFKTFNKSGDLYVLFVELGSNLLNANGRLGYILPHKFFIADYGSQIRSYLSDNKLIERIVDFEHHQVFQGVMTYTCLIYLDKSMRSSFFYQSLKEFNQKDYLYSENLNTEVVPLNKVKAGAWDFGIKQHNIKHDGCMSLEDVSEQMYQGLATTCDPVFILKEKNGKLFSKYLNDYVEVEKSILKPIYRGKELKKYQTPKATEWVIFPYEVKSLGEYEPIAIEQMKKSFPKALNYLSKCRKKLDVRENGKFAKSKNWHLYTQEHNLGYFDVPKIITKVMSKDGCFSIDKGGKYYFVGGGTAGGYGIVIKKKYIKDINLIVAILNSKLIFEYTKKKNSVFKGGYYSFSKKTLKDIPLKIENVCQETREAIEEAVQDLLKNGYTDQRQKKLDVLVEELYSKDESCMKVA